jgi:hypothetical protein
MLCAREAIVVVVGARPREYGRIIVRDRRTGEYVEIDNTDSPPLDEGDEGVGYAFKAFQRVSADHPAVLACPSAFVPADDADPAQLQAADMRDALAQMQQDAALAALPQ